MEARELANVATAEVDDLIRYDTYVTTFSQSVPTYAYSRQRTTASHLQYSD